MNWKRWVAFIAAVMSVVGTFRQSGIDLGEVGTLALATAVVLVGTLAGAVVVVRDLIGLAGKLADNDSDRNVWHYLRPERPDP